VLPGVVAVSALHRYIEAAPQSGVAKHYWMLSVIGFAVVIALVTWTIRRRHGGGAIEPVVEPGRKDRH